MVSPSHKRRAVQVVMKAGLCSQRRACRYLGLQRSSGRYQQKEPSAWLQRLHEQVEALSRQYPRQGYRKLTRTLRRDGWNVGRKLVQRIRRECGLRVKRWMRRRRRRGRSTGIIPTRAERLNHVWSWDFIADRTDNGGKLRILSILDEYSRECLALHGARKLTAQDLIDVMEKLAEERGLPTHIRSDNGSEFIARILQGWLAERQVKTLYIEPGSPWQNGHVESFHGSLRDECLDRELMLSVAEARVLIEDYRRHYNEERPHGGIGYRTPAQTRIEAQALDSSRPAGSLRQELESSHPLVTVQT
jgi:putative transposase